MMNGSQDLDAIDKATLRLWRTTNLVGWGVAGVAAFAAVGAIGAMLARTPATMWLALPLGLMTLVLGCVAAGWVIGSHVYRSPVLVTIAAFIAPGVVGTSWRLASGESMGLPELGVVLLFGAVPGLFASLAARAAWTRRPRALRGP